ncbi:MAG TPA: ATP-binding protein [Devosiaceae bacterium]|nr:ATP-binding protein [Devosiaceae bacterium]
MAEHQLERIFNPLFTTKTGGMGMGLTICRSIIEAHDGRRWATPNVPEGAIFQFRLLADVGAPAAGARGQAADAVRTGSRQ